MTLQRNLLFILLLGLAAAAIAAVLVTSESGHLAEFSKNLAYASPFASEESGPWKHLALPEPHVDDLHRALALQNGGAFNHGIASGDPLADAVILWTRITPPPGAAAADVYAVRYTVASDEALTDVVRTGFAFTNQDVDYTVKVDIKQLEPATVYYYQFSVAKDAVKTAVGRTKTLPAEDAAVDKIAIASVSCAYYAYGEFTAYGKIAEKYEDLDIVLHLGDYIYEYGNVNGADGTESALFSKVLIAQQSRAPVGKSMLPPTTCVSLDDYRQRYALYHTDVNLVELHRVLPWIVVPDDHEVVDNGYEDGAAAHDPATQGPYQLRVNAGLRAWHEWVPNRQFRAPAAYQRFYRAFQFGTLAELIMLDTRYDGRDKQAPQPTSADDFVDYAKITATNKIMGDVQMAWITDKLATSTAQWKILGNQVPFTDTVDIKTVAANPLTIALINTDSWAGYKASQQQLLAAMENVEDVVILTGDIHTPFAMQVFQKPNGQPYAAEYVTTSITSPGIGEFAQDGLGIGPAIQNIIVDAVLESPNVVNLELFCHGYHITTYTATEVTAQYYCMDDIHDPANAAERESWKYVTCSGTNTVVEAADAAC